MRLRVLFARATGFLGVRWRDGELRDEIETHLKLLTEEFIAAGMPVSAARANARRQFGGVAQVTETYRDQRSFRLIDSWLQDARYAVRACLQHPGFTAVAVFTLAIGIGANTAVFSAVDALLWHPASVKQPDRVVAIRVNADKLHFATIAISPRDFALIRDSPAVFAEASIGQSVDFSYVAGDLPERLAGVRVSWQWFDVFGPRPTLGRSFRPDEDQPNANRVVILAFHTWRRLFGSDPSVVGTTIQLNQQPYHVIGVLPPESDSGIVLSGRADHDDVYVPLGLPAAEFAPDNGFNENYLGFARLQRGVPLKRAQAFMDVLTERALQDPNGDEARRLGWRLSIIPITDAMAGSLESPMVVLVGAVGLVLLIVCANLAGLNAARASSRSHELAIRASLGASRLRLVRQALTESTLLSLVGAVMGIGIAAISTHLLARLGPSDLVSGTNLRLDARVLAFVAAVTVVVATLCGTAPAWHAGLDTHRGLREADRATTASRAHLRFRSTVVTLEVAIALILLVGAGLFVRTLRRLQETDVGFQSRGVLTGVMSLPHTRYSTPAEQVVFYRAAIAHLRSISGVTAASVALPMPFFGQSAGNFDIDGLVRVPGEPMPHAEKWAVSPEFFSTLQIPIKSGRAFTDSDTPASAPVVIIDEALARRYWPGRNPIGQRVRRAVANDNWSTVVGVVGRIRYSDLADDAAEGIYYRPLYQDPAEIATLQVKTALLPTALSTAVRDAVRAVDPGQPVYGVRSMDEIVADILRGRRVTVAVLTCFAAIGVLVAMVGLHGVIAYSVAQRTQEIGTRMALGARSTHIARMIVGQTLALGLSGLTLGMIGALLLSRTVASLMYNVSPTDPVSFLIGVTLLLVSTIVAAYVPARNAARVDPIVALRCE